MSEPAAASAPDRARRELSVAVGLCLLGAALALIAVGRTWVQVQVAATALLPARTVGVPGSDLASGATALALVGLAGVVALAATRRLGRVAVGVLLLLDGAGLVALTLDRLRSLPSLALVSDRVVDAGAGSTARTSWPYACVLGASMIAVAGLLVAVRGRGWAALGRRFEPPVAAVPAGQAGERPATDAPVPERPDPSGSATPDPSRPAPGSTAPPPPANPDPAATTTATTTATTGPDRTAPLDGADPSCEPPSERQLWEALDRGEDPTGR